MKLMIVDDHPGVRDLIRHLVGGRADTEVCECASGEEAVRAASRFQPDLVTMDVRMPGLSGFAATRALLEVHPSARVVIVTLFPLPDLRDAAASCGAVACVVKENLAQLRAVFVQHGFEACGATEALKPQS